MELESAPAELTPVVSGALVEQAMRLAGVDLDPARRDMVVAQLDDLLRDANAVNRFMEERQATPLAVRVIHRGAETRGAA